VSFAEKVLPEHTAIHLFDVVNKGEKDLVLKKNPDFNTNDVLQYFMHKGLTVQGFNEILPSLNDIFIRIVEGTPNARQFDNHSN
jgi:ABC-2 type transport system ATP-binding protein